ncbi:MAG: hypothetical protein RI947_735 [Candidatus Parcubacteria bacterium]|jgi:hypothetical protein
MRLTITKIIITAFITIVLGLGTYGWYRSQQLDTSYPAIKKHLSQFMTVPDDKPIVVEVSDAATLKKQDPFYKEAQPNDIIIIWKEKAIIYRPSTQRVIDWGVIIK